MSDRPGACSCQSRLGSRSILSRLPSHDGYPSAINGPRTNAPPKTPPFATELWRTPRTGQRCITTCLRHLSVLPGLALFALVSGFFVLLGQGISALSNLSRTFDFREIDVVQGFSFVASQVVALGGTIIVLNIAREALVMLKHVKDVQAEGGTA